MSHATVQRILARPDKLQPHRLERYMASDDPDFELKAADIIGLYLNPPQHAAVFCVDEKTAVQALDRLDPVLPLSPGRAERHGFQYYRHGTLSLYAALDVKTGRVDGKTTRRHTSADFIGFLGDLVARTRWAKEIHIVLDNLFGPQNTGRPGVPGADPKVRSHFTPAYSSWLNQVSNSGSQRFSGTFGMRKLPLKTTAAQSAGKELARLSTTGAHWFCLSAVLYGRF